MSIRFVFLSTLLAACGSKKNTVSPSQTPPAAVETNVEVETKTKSSLIGQWSDLGNVTGDVIATATDETNKTGEYIGSPSIFTMASNIEISPLAFNADQEGEYGEQIRLTINEDLTGKLYSNAIWSYNKDFDGTSSNIYENISQNGKVTAKENTDGSYTLSIEMLTYHVTVCKDQNIDERAEKNYNLTVVCMFDGNGATCTHEDGKTNLKR